MFKGIKGGKRITKEQKYLSVPTISSKHSSQTSSSSYTTESVQTTNELTITMSSSWADNTLSMISTPWSTETWLTPSTIGYSVSKSTSLTWPNSGSSSYRLKSTSSVRPKSTISSARPSPELRSSSRITLTLLTIIDTATGSRPIESLKESKTPTDTQSVWTTTNFTSTIVSSKSGVKVAYPWSPGTFSYSDFTDFYPSTENLISRKGSRETIDCANGKEDRMTPMNFLLGPMMDENPFLDWLKVKREGVLNSQRVVA